MKLQVFLDPHLFKLGAVADLFLCILQDLYEPFIQKNTRDWVHVLCRCHKVVMRALMAIFPVKCVHSNLIL